LDVAENKATKKSFDKFKEQGGNVSFAINFEIGVGGGTTFM